MSLIESDVQKNINRFFIDQSPTWLAISRPTLVDDGAGGKVPTTSTNLPNQRVRVVSQARPRTLVTPDGRQVEVDMSLVAMPDLDVRIGDYFTVDDIEYEVVNLQDQPHWRVIVEAIRRVTVAVPVITGAFDSGFDDGFE